MSSLVLIHLGTTWLPYINDCIYQIRRFSKIPIYLVLDTVHKDLVDYNDVILIDCKNLLISKYHKTFRNNTKLSKTFRDEFFIKTTERFFYLHQLMKTYDLQNVFHIEYDNLIFFNPLDHLDTFKSEYNFTCVVDNFNRGVGSFMYIKDVNHIEQYVKHILASDMKLNDMETLANFMINKSTLPLIPSWHNKEICSQKFGKDKHSKDYYAYGFDKFKAIFDGAAIGQYMYGTHLKKKIGFINERTVFKMNDYNTEWINNIPYLCSLSSNNKCRINNLHMHCKNLGQIVYKSRNDLLIDVIIPLASKDLAILPNVIDGLKKYMINCGRIICITPDQCKDDILKLGIEWISETVFPFSMKDVQNIHGITKFNGWYLQQLLKLYAFKVVANLSQHHLILDGDTILLKPITFYDVATDKSLFFKDKRWYKPYFKHMNELHPSLKRMNEKLCGIANLMMFKKEYLFELFNLVEQFHHKTFWKIFLEKVDPKRYEDPGASEYEIYFNFMLAKHPDKMNITELPWCNGHTQQVHKRFYFVSCHYYLIQKAKKIGLLKE